MTSLICDPRAIVTSPWPIVLTLYLWTLSSSQWRCQPGRFSMAAHRHDRRGIYRCVLLRFRGRIEIDHSYGLRCRGLCCHSRHSTRGTGWRTWIIVKSVNVCMAFFLIAISQTQIYSSHIFTSEVLKYKSVHRHVRGHTHTQMRVYSTCSQNSIWVLVHIIVHY